MRVSSVGDIHIRRNLLEITRFEVLNQKMLDALTDSSTTSEFKDAAARLLMMVSKRSPGMSEKIRAHLDIEALLRQHLVTKDSHLL
jgi:hypothetical protein